MSDPGDDAFVGTLRDAWVETRMEKDRTLLTLASGGIGLLTTLGTSVGPSSWFELVLYFLAGASFVAAIVTALEILGANSRHIEEVLRTRSRDDDPKLMRMDRVLFWSFLGGVLLTGAIALTSGYSHIRKANAVANQNKQITGTTQVKESLSGIGRLQNTAASGQEQKSLSGIGRLQGGGTGNQSGSGSGATTTTTGGSASGSGGAALSGDKK